MSQVVKRSILFWVPLPFIGVINGIFRGVFLASFTSDFHARQISSLLMVVWIAVYIRVIWKKLQLVRLQDAWIVGLVWMLLTVVFEFSLGYFVSHMTVAEMLADYNIIAGRLWSLVIISLLVMPVIYYVNAKNLKYFT